CAHVTAFYGARPEDAASPMPFSVLHGDDRIDLSLRFDGAAVTVELPGRRLLVETDWRAGEPLWRGSIDGAAVRFRISTADDLMTLARGGQRTPLCALESHEADLFVSLYLTVMSH